MRRVLSDEVEVNSAAATQLVDETIDRYLVWQDACATVRIRYERWACDPGVQQLTRFAAYEAALDGEEHAAELYAVSLERLGRLLWPDVGPR